MVFLFPPAYFLLLPLPDVFQQPILVHGEFSCAQEGSSIAAVVDTRRYPTTTDIVQQFIWQVETEVEEEERKGENKYGK